MITVNLFVESHYIVDRRKIRATVERVLNENRIKEAEVDISIVGSRKIAKLNASALKHEGSTDVLSFPQHEKHQLHDFPLPEGQPPHLGDVIVSFPEAINAARRYGKRVDDQICFYIQHGLMHLLGYHHQHDDQVAAVT